METNGLKLNDTIINLVGNIDTTNPSWRDTLAMDILSLVLEVRS